MKAAPLWKSARFTLAMFSFFGFLNFYALRVNMSFSVVCMVNQTAIRHYDAVVNGNNVTTPLDRRERRSECETLHPGETNTLDSNYTNVDLEDGELVWDKHTQGLLHGSIFWGYIVTNLAGGILATRYGGKHVIGLSLLAAALLTFLVPWVARNDVIGLMVLRFCTGFSLGFVSPAMQSLWSHWAPPLESSRLRSICFAGSQMGKVLTYPITALLCEYGFDGGWPSIFYVQGIFGVLWFTTWTLMVHDSPAKHPRITEAERKYIESSLRGMMPTSRQAKRSTPWMSILSSPAVWAIIVAHTCGNWGEYTFLTNIPTYMTEVLHFDIKKNGFLSSVPYICFWVVISSSSWLADLLRTKEILTTTTTRKLFNSIGTLVPALLLIGLSFVGCSQSATAVTLLTLGVALTGFQYGGGLYMNAGDIAPKYAGVIYGISNTVATLPGFLAPLSIGLLTEDQTQEQWRAVFYVSAGIYVFGAIVFLIFSSGNLQEWATDSTSLEIHVDAPEAPEGEGSDHIPLKEDEVKAMKDCEEEAENCEEDRETGGGTSDTQALKNER